MSKKKPRLDGTAKLREVVRLSLAKRTRRSRPVNDASYYVYALIDPRDMQPFYIGKGRGERARSHLRPINIPKLGNVGKCRRVAEIVEGGGQVIVKMVAEGLTEDSAFKRERQEIAAGRRNGHLTNLAPGMKGDVLDRAWIQINWLIRNSKPKAQWVVEWASREKRAPNSADADLYDEIMRGHHEVRLWIARKMLERYEQEEKADPGRGRRTEG